LFVRCPYTVLDKPPLAHGEPGQVFPTRKERRVVGRRIAPFGHGSRHGAEAPRQPKERAVVAAAVAVRQGLLAAGPPPETGEAAALRVADRAPGANQVAASSVRETREGIRVLRRVLMRAVVIILSATTILTTLTGPPAAAGDCDWPGCGGEVSNNSSWKSILISNCWDNGSTWTQEGHFLACHSYPGTSPRVGNVDNAAIPLQPGDWSSEEQYSEYYDTDAIRFPSGCVTTAHFWGGSRYTTDRRGKPPLWGRIAGYHHFYIDGVSCP
jgi:hypothetical protein